MSFNEHPTLDRYAVTIPMSSLHIIRDQSRRAGITSSSRANRAPPDAEAMLAIRLALCAGQISNDHELGNAVHALVGSYNDISGKKRKFEEYLYDDDEIAAREAMERTDRARAAGPHGRNMSGGNVSSSLTLPVFSRLLSEETSIH